MPELPRCDTLDCKYNKLGGCYKGPKNCNKRTQFQQSIGDEASGPDEDED